MMRCEMEQEIESLRQHLDVWKAIADGRLAEIGFAQQQLAECQAESANWFRKYMEENDTLAESQAREKVLRDDLATWVSDDPAGGLVYLKAMHPSDSTALDSAIRQAKREGAREALLEASEVNIGQQPEFQMSESNPVIWKMYLRRMADELKD